MSAPPAIGPWAPGLTDLERTARLRELRALCAAFAGGSRSPAVHALARAEHDPDALAEAWRLVDRLPTRWKRNILSTAGKLADLSRAAARQHFPAGHAGGRTSRSVSETTSAASEMRGSCRPSSVGAGTLLDGASAVARPSS